MLLLAASAGARAQDATPAPADRDPSPHSDAELVAEVGSVQPGTPFTVALRLQMEDGWHSYWQNPGDSGMPTSIAWALPDGFEAGPIQWPYPQRIELPPLVSYGYEGGEVLLLVEITPPEDLRPGDTVALEGEASWLVCAEICLPAAADLSLELSVRAADPAPDARWQPRFAAARDQLPAAVDGLAGTAYHDAGSYVLSLEVPAGRDVSPDGAYFYVAEQGVLDHAAPQTAIRDGDTFRLALQASPYASEPAGRLQGVLVAPDGEAWDAAGTHRALAVDVPVVAGAPAAAAPSAPAQGASLTLLAALLLAFGGGLLLNLMPCVFPVLSLKILGFAGHAGDDAATVRRHGFVFGGGVLLSFLLLAGLLLLLRAGGEQLGWGFQLQSPAFVALMAMLLFGIGLNLMGVFEVGVSLVGLGGGGGQETGYRNAFLSGVLATVVATPCTAPLMGAALGFALTQTTAAALLIFGVLGLGMATPYVLLSSWPALLRRLPRPGPWMETLKQALAFPMFATAVWLVWVFGQQAGIDGVGYLLLALVLLALGAWIVGRWNALQLSTPRRLFTRGLAVLALIGAVGAALYGARGTPASAALAEQDATWQPFSSERIDELRDAGQPVFVDFTAAWCLTCQVNKRAVLTTAEVQDAFRARNVALFRADWTNRDAEITAALESFGRSGVPLYVLYDGTGSAPQILPEILTKDLVLDALEAVPASPVAERQALR